MDKSFPRPTGSAGDNSNKKAPGRVLTGYSSVAVHGGHRQDPNYAHQVPIYASSTYVYDTAEQGMRRFSGKEEGYIYSRWGNPTMTEAVWNVEMICFLSDISCIYIAEMRHEVRQSHPY